LKENLKQMVHLDTDRGILFQRQAFFNDCVRYFQALSQQRHVELNDPREVCQVPFTSIVVDESGHLYPCFYLPYSISLGPGEADPLNSDFLKAKRKEIFNNPEIRKKYCSFCLQFQG
jgi:radical SAM protein with 4Fe4S-binding SPASM domain